MVSPDRVRAMEDAISDRNLKKVRLLLKAGVPADHVYGVVRGFTFLHLAASVGDAEIFSCLAEAGAAINRPGLLETAACRDRSSPTIVEMVLSAGNPSQSDRDEALLYAANNPNLGIVDLLLGAGASPRYQNDEGATALMHAVMSGHREVVTRLAALGANPDRRIPYPEHYKKTIREVAELQGMQDVLSGEPPAAAAAVQPRTLTEAWHLLSDWLRSHAPDVSFTPEPASSPQWPADLPATEALREWFSLPKGSAAGLVPMPNDIPHVLLSLREALQARTAMLEVMELQQESWWHSTWVPVATNGAGDYLVCNTPDGSVLHVTHEGGLSTPRAPSLFELFREIAVGVQTGKYSFHPQRGLS